MSTEENGDMGFANRDCSVMNITNLVSGGKVSEMAMSSVSMFKSSNGPNPNPKPKPFFDSGWNPLASLNQSENFGGSSSIPRNEFNNNPAYPPTMLDNHQSVGGFTHLVHYQSDSGLGEMVPKLPCFGGNGSFSEMVGSFGLSDSGQLTSNQCPQNYPQNTENNPKFGANSEEGGSPGGKKKRRTFDKNVEGDQQKDNSEGSSEQDEKKQRIEQILRGKQTGKQTKENSDSGEAPAKENYIHVRAKRGQATNSHSLAERVRRERISERMRLLQELVPGCNKITGKAVMLDEIINYVQSLQQQVEFLSMKLATVNPEININMERILAKDVTILHSQGSNASILGFGPGLSSPHPYSQGITPGNLPGISNTTSPFHPLPQIVWDNELQTLLQMGFDSNAAVENMGPNGRSKLDL